MTWIKALNGSVFDLPNDLADILVMQGHEKFDTEAEARVEQEPARAPVRKTTTRTK